MPEFGWREAFGAAQKYCRPRSHGRGEGDEPQSRVPRESLAPKIKKEVGTQGNAIQTLASGKFEVMPSGWSPTRKQEQAEGRSIASKLASQWGAVKPKGGPKLYTHARCLAETLRARW